MESVEDDEDDEDEDEDAPEVDRSSRGGLDSAEGVGRMISARRSWT